MKKLSELMAKLKTDSSEESQEVIATVIRIDKDAQIVEAKQEPNEAIE